MKRALLIAVVLALGAGVADAKQCKDAKTGRFVTCAPAGHAAVLPAAQVQATPIQPVTSGGATSRQLSSTGQVTNTWTRVSRDGVYPTEYLDVRHLYRTRKTSSIWSMQDFGPGARLERLKPFLSARYLVEYDCTRPVHRTLFYGTYSDHMGQGKLVGGDPNPEGWIPNPPNAPITDQAMTIACNTAPAR